jgi:hypothetical protein
MSMATTYRCWPAAVTTSPGWVTAAGIAADRATGGYRILKSNGGVDAFNAPCYGSLAWHVPGSP